MVVELTAKPDADVGDCTFSVAFWIAIQVPDRSVETIGFGGEEEVIAERKFRTEFKNGNRTEVAVYDTLFAVGACEPDGRVAELQRESGSDFPVFVRREVVEVAGSKEGESIREIHGFAGVEGGAFDPEVTLQRDFRFKLQRLVQEDCVMSRTKLEFGGESQEAKQYVLTSLVNVVEVRAISTVLDPVPQRVQEAEFTGDGCGYIQLRVCAIRSCGVG